MSKDSYQTLTKQQQRELLDEVSKRRGLHPAVLEKDYWVCRTLDALFSLPDLGDHLVFKGGTSLSKVYGLIERFSEDVDVSFHRAYLGFGDENEPEAAGSGKQLRRRLEELMEACAVHIRDRLLPELNKDLENRLGGRDGWSLEISPDDPRSILFHYPQAGSDIPAYVRQSVLIELGARSDHWPKESRQIRSYIGDTLDLPLAVANVQSLAAERTFWEKATLLHAECHRPSGKPIPARYARHFHDLAQLAVEPVAERALVDTGLRCRVVEHKSVYFRSAWAQYDLAEPGSFRLVPDDARVEELRRDHRDMEVMLFSEPLTVEAIIGRLRELEDKINTLPS